MKILLGNDTSVEEHVGCKAVCDAHARMLGGAGHSVTERLFGGSLEHHNRPLDSEIVSSILGDDVLVERIDAVDAVVLNGEGTIHHGAGRAWLGLLAVAQARGKSTLIVNAVFQEMAGFDNVLQRLDDFTVRESRSLAHARQRGLRARRVPDALLAASFIEGQRLGSGEMITDGHWNCEATLRSLEALGLEMGAQPFSMTDPQLVANWREAPSRLAGADLLITGRHHGAYLALMAGVPFVALASNTYKLEGLVEDLGRPDMMAHSLEEARAARLRLLEEKPDMGALLRRLTGDAPLDSFRVLGRGGPDRAEAEVRRLADDVARRASGA